MNESPNMPDTFDRLIGALEGLPDVVKSKPSTIRTIVFLVGSSQIWVVQTYRQLVPANKNPESEARKGADTIFIETVSKEGSLRLAIPPDVADAIARQRESLTGKSRSKAAKAVAADRKERGIQPAFLKKGKSK